MTFVVAAAPVTNTPTSTPCRRLFRSVFWPEAIRIAAESSKTFEKLRISRFSIVDPVEPAASTSPSASPAPVPSRITVPVCRLSPSMSTGPVIAGRADASEISLLSRSNSIVFAPLAAFAFRIACRRDPAPASFVLTTVNVLPPSAAATRRAAVVQRDARRWRRCRRRK